MTPNGKGEAVRLPLRGTGGSGQLPEVAHSPRTAGKGDGGGRAVADVEVRRPISQGWHTPLPRPQKCWTG